MSAFYNEIEPYAADWLVNLEQAGHIAAGRVDRRSIVDLTTADLAGATQAHFFAGLGGWSYALRLAGVPDSAAVWTGSCPCQPFSAAGKRGGFADERHLWPAWFKLIEECRPPVIFGEQVASPDGLKWLDAVFADLEGAGYAVGAADLCAAGVGAPHLRQRLYFVADSGGERLNGIDLRLRQQGADGKDVEAAGSGQAGALADAEGCRRERREGSAESGARRGRDGLALDGGDSACLVGDASGAGSGRDARAVLGEEAQGGRERRATRRELDEPQPASHWGDLEWLDCLDGKRRPTKPGLHPLAHGPAASLERMRAEEDAAWKEILEYGTARQTNPRQVLRTLRESILAQEGGQESTTRMREQLPAPQVLLPLLLRLESAHAGGKDRRRKPEAGTKDDGAGAVRGVRSRADGGSPRQRRSDGQPGMESAEALHLLSLILARHAEAYRAASDDADASANRVGKLRAGGNAIVPEAAATFIQAYLSAAEAA